MRTKTQDTWHLNNYYPNVTNLITLNSKQSRQKTQKAQEDTKLVFQNELEENTGMCKPVLNKIMTTHEIHVKYNFLALEITITK